ncbi:MAG: glutaredoxin family protein [Deltaproteobacteria bacterium]|nr:glutaredoxin family protein [Deltaproteobacteria bacterium]
MRSVTLYTREGCHLCDDALGVLEAVRQEAPSTLTVTVIDVDSDPALRELYGMEVPVIAVDGRKAFKYRVTAEALRRRLAREAP